MSTPPLTLVILAAGSATRFGRLKQLVPIGPGGEALLDYALYDAVLAGFSRFVLVIQEVLRQDFDTHLDRVRTAGLDIGYAYQRRIHPGLFDTPPRGRVRPWGTGHAVLAAGQQVNGPFAVCNADDFYGRGAYATLARAMCKSYFTESKAKFTSTTSFTVGYPLEVTLSDSGGVSRGICEVGEAGALERLTEGLQLSRHGDRVRGHDATGRPIDVPLNTPVCTNLWGFGPGIVPLLRDLFAGFLAGSPGVDDEFFLTDAINTLIAARRARCTVLTTRERWRGVTFPADHAGVARSLRELADSGVYPMRLWDTPPAPAKPVREDQH